MGDHCESLYFVLFELLGEADGGGGGGGGGDLARDLDDGDYQVVGLVRRGVRSVQQFVVCVAVLLEGSALGGKYSREGSHWAVRDGEDRCCVYSTLYRQGAFLRQIRYSFSIWDSLTATYIFTRDFNY